MNPTRSLAFVLATLVSFALAATTHAAEVWRLAGTFNSWDTRDDAWAMTPAEDQPGVWVLEKRIPRGSNQFKFVYAGEWGSGHLGLDTGDRVVQPGSDIPLVTPAEAVYRITLDTNANSWSMVPADLDAPIVIADVWGVPTAGRTFHVSFARSMTNSRASLQAEATDGADATEVPGVPATLAITPAAPGPLDVTFEISDDSGATRHAMTFDVQPLYTLQLIHQSRAPQTLDLTAGPDGIATTVIEFDERTAFDALRFRRGRSVIAQELGAVFDPGTYRVEVGPRGPAPSPTPDGPNGVIPGNWHTFRVPAEFGTATAHIIGDFNDWARPGLPGAIELTPHLEDGALVFTGVTNLPRGAHRYQVLLDGDRVEADPNAEAQLPFDDGTPASVVRVGPRPEDFPAVGPDHIVTDAVSHDPFSPTDLKVISEDMGLVDVALRTMPGDAQQVTMLLDPGTPEERGVTFTRSDDPSGFDRWSARILDGDDTLDYGFEIKDGPVVFRYGPFTQRLTAPTPDTPDWAKGAVWYQIFPERFRNANPTNDPHGPGVFQMPWTADWYETAPGEEEQWRPRAGLGPNDPLDRRQGGDLYHWIWDRRYGGDLQGVLEKLDWIHEFGVTAIYFNPIFEADSMHKYDASSYHHIDDNFANTTTKPTADWTGVPGETADPSTWTWTEADRFFLDVFLPACRERGIRVVLDGVWNHTGRNFWAFRDVMENGADSPYADWYFVEFDDNGDLESWTAWDQPSGWLPKFRQDDERNLVEPVKQHIFDVTRRWMDPNGDGNPADGIDGWRLDVALDVGLPFWEEWRELVKGLNPEAIIIAEIWEDNDAVLTGDHFDTRMHYPFAHAVTDWLAVRPGMTSAELHRELAPAFDNPEQVNLIHQNLYASHDTDRLASQLFNPGRDYDDGNRVQDNGPNYKQGRPDQKSFDLAKLAFAIQATYLGAPMVYYGDEVGMWGADDPSDRKPLPWPDQGPMDDPDETYDADFRAYAAEWLNLRHHPVIGAAICYGRTKPIESGSDEVFAFERSLEGRRVVVAINRGDEPFDASSLLGGVVEESELPARSAKWWTTD
ncbi:MAG: alpha-amylase family glycosyl hydrolase [Phycisphaerales bacterium]